MIMGLPALPVLVLGAVAWHDPRDRYWANVYLVWGTVLAVLSTVTAGSAIRRTGAAQRSVSQRQLLASGFVAWGLSFFVLVAINLSPLCLGQDNGDGRNGVFTCILLAVVWFLFMSLPVGGGIAVAAMLARRVANGGDEDDAGRKRENEIGQP